MSSRHHELRTASLKTLIALAQAEDSDDTAAMDSIVVSFEPLTTRMARMMSTGCEHLRDDIANASRMALVRAVRRHDTGRAGFPAYAERFMRGAALRVLQRWQQREAGFVPARLEDAAEPSEADFQDEALDRISPWGDGRVAEAVATLSPSQLEIATLRYVYDAPLDVIASRSGTTVSAVSQRLSTIHRRVELAFAA